MIANSALERAHPHGPLAGFGNLFRKELLAWWGAHRWWVQVLL